MTTSIDVTKKIKILEETGFLSIRASASLVGVCESSLRINLKTSDSFSKLVNFLLEEGFTEKDLNQWVKTGIPKEAVLKILDYYAFFVNKPNKAFAYNTLSLLKFNLGVKIGKAPKKKTEEYYRDKIAEKLRGKTEVKTLVGNIDVLTDSEVIEVKNIRYWKSALGQVLAYSSFYPLHTRRLHLFGKTKESTLTRIADIASNYQVVISWEL